MKRTYNATSQNNAMRTALDDYYRRHPDVEVKHKSRTLGEILLPTLSGIGAGHLLKNVIKSPTLKKFPTRAGAGLGLAIALPYQVVASGSRRKKILEDIGIKTNIIGSYANPINDKGRKYFK